MQLGWRYVLCTSFSIKVRVLLILRCFSIGDCCGDDVNTTFCTDCQCLDPDFGGAECKDIWKTKKCIRRKNKGKCGKKKVKKNCQKTCEYCTAAGRIEDLFDEDDLFEEEFDEDLE